MKLLILLLLISSQSLAMPTRDELRKATVKVLNTTMNGGGTGTIVSSSPKGSLILTNSHVCEVVESGGYITNDNNKYKVTNYKLYDGHDLCLVKVSENLKVNTKITKTRPKINDTSIVSGHPHLLPNIITMGHFTDRLSVNVLVGFEQCEEQSLECAFFGGKPIVKTYESQLISNLILPGNSGSAVYNSKGEIAGVVFAGNKDLSFAFIVPHIYVNYFMQIHNQIPWARPENKPAMSTSIIRDAKKKCKQADKVVSEYISQICDLLEQDLTIRK